MTINTANNVSFGRLHIEGINLNREKEGKQIAKGLRNAAKDMHATLKTLEQDGIDFKATRSDRGVRIDLVNTLYNKIEGVVFCKEGTRPAKMLGDAIAKAIEVIRQK